MPAITYNYTAANCPIPPSAGAMIDPYSATPDTVMALHEYIELGEVETGWNKHNRNTIRQEAESRWGLGGGRYVAQGLALSTPAGLTGRVGTGTAMIDGPAVLNSDADTAIPNSTARSLFFMGQASDILTNDVDLAYPTDPAAFLGSFSTSGGVVTEIDYSGRLFRLPGGILMRRTADLSAPTDSGSLPSDLMFLTKTVGGIYLWDGTAYSRLQSSEGFRSVSGTGSVTDADAGGIISADASGGSITLTLPTAVGRAGRRFSVIKINSANTVNVASTSAQTFNGGASPLAITTQWQSKEFVSDGANWLVR